MVSLQYPDTVQQKIGLLEAANGAGLFVGPIFGGLIYQFTHFCVPFMFFTALFLILLPIMKPKFKDNLERTNSTDDGKRKVIPYTQLLRYKRVTFAALAQFFNVLEFTMGTPIFGPRLNDDYGFSDAVVGVLFACPTITYILTGPLFLPLITSKFNLRAKIMTGFIILIGAGFLIGPSKLLGFPELSAPMMI